MRKYRTLDSVAKLLGGYDHATILHYVGSKDEKEGVRKKSNKFKENTACIKDFLGP